MSLQALPELLESNLEDFIESEYTKIVAQLVDLKAVKDLIDCSMF